MSGDQRHETTFDSHLVRSQRIDWNSMRYEGDMLAWIAARVDLPAGLRHRHLRVTSRAEQNPAVKTNMIGNNLR